jgi:hypothetical protein
MAKLYPSISGLSILMALALALGEWCFFFYRGTWEGPFGLFAPSRLGFNLAWLTLVYLSFQLLSIPLAVGSRQRFIGVIDGMASLIPLGIALVVILGKPEFLARPSGGRRHFYCYLSLHLICSEGICSILLSAVGRWT